ncbi:hypothetical protein [Phaeobacter sp. B1627]|nr:hypothetical protein [Phaeobacter sp. B1627]
MGDEFSWPLPEAAGIMGEVLADLADSGPEDGRLAHCACCDLA